MVKVEYRNLQTHRDETYIVDYPFDEDMPDSEIDRVFIPMVKQYLGHPNFRINAVSEV
ncbi:hypothetical protein [Lysinibacillus odysseyi]|uniref:hypothetical protein n=1 Tax=Lysinibacillus odysseyi TaxID=202611 RepID=UPI000B157AAD|nr:hypothetical protein [Lysinibacillus odysseyi]